MHSDVIGSLLRPDALKTARRRLEAGEIAAAELKRVEDGAVDDVVALQERAGLDVITDGEMRRYAFFGHLIEALDGFDKLGGWAIPFHDEQGGELVFKRPVVVDRLRWRRSMCGEEFAYLRARATRQTKVTLISTQQAAAYYDPEKSKGAYPTRVFTRARFQRFLLEYDDERSGGFEPLRAVPDDRHVVLGLVTTKKQRLESVDELRRRIQEAAKLVPLERLALSPQCGFASTMEGNRVSPDDQRRKLERVAETARLLWGP